MQDEIKVRGGAIVGAFRMRWPFATLKITGDVLELNCSIVGTFIFRPGDIDSIVFNNNSFKSGIRIKHHVANYNPNIVFKSMKSEELLDKINRIGFLENSSAISAEEETEISESQKNGAFPLKIPAAIFILIIWNGLILVDFWNFYQDDENNSPIGVYTRVAFVFMIFTALLLLFSGPVRRLILKEGRSVAPIRIFLYFTIIICGLMLLMLKIG